MKVTVIPGRDLTPDLIAHWRAIQAATPALASPFLCPEFTLLAAQTRGDVFVGVLEDGGRTIGFFPFQRARYGFGRPVGGAMSDYQAVIVGDADVAFDAADLVRRCRLAAWDFDHLIAAQHPFARFHAATTASPVLQLPDGYDAWAAARKAAGSDELGNFARKGRKLGREVGELRYTHHDADTATLQHVMDLKRGQYQRTGAVDVFAHPWPVEFLRRIHQTRAGDEGDGAAAGASGSEQRGVGGFAGILSTLHAGDRLVAAHMGMRSASVWHWWFPVYDPELSKYSPGILLLLEMAKEAHTRGITLIDFGKGDEEYKHRLKTADIAIAEGSVDTRCVTARCRRAQRAAIAWLDRAPGPVRPVASIPGRALRRLERQRRFL